MLLRILIVALCCSLLSCKDLVEKYKRSSSGVSTLDKRELYDFRKAVTSKPPDVDRETELKVFAAIPPASCPESKATTAKLRINSSATGSFTYAAEQETAYLVSGLPCQWPNKVIVLSAEKLQASSDTPYTHIAASFDLNHDDKNELLLAGETTHDGDNSREASLETFEKNSLRAVENFGIVYHDTCARFAGADEAKKKSLIAQGLSPFVEAVVVSYLPRPGHEMPSFSAQRFRAPCPADPGAAPANWEAVSPK
jgi:hypothetical protein